MPLKWTISHPDRMVTMQAEGEITLTEAEEYLDALVVADAMAYAKLVDCSTMVTHVSDDEMMMLGARMRAYASVMKGGPLVFVVTSPELNDYVRRYINLAAAERPVKIVRTVDEARAWLKTQDTAHPS
jgi:gamma-glutamyl phosphate reductase